MKKRKKKNPVIEELRDEVLELKEENKELKQEKDKKSRVVTFRVFQAIFFGMIALGLSLMSGDYTTYVKSPISSISITTTIFGIIGSIITGILSKSCEKW